MIITFCCFTVLSAAAGADIIVLKNGDRIVVDAVQERNGRVEYWIGNNTLTIPKSIVARIEVGPPTTAPSNVHPQPTPPVELPRVRETMTGTEQLIARVIRNGAVDTAGLKAVEQEGISEQSATANAIAASFEESKNNPLAAVHYLENALRFLPKHPVLLENYTSLLLQLGRTAEALSYAQRAASAGPQSAEAFTLLGYAYYKNDRNREAIAAYKKSLQLRPDERVRQLLEHVERESKTEADFREQDSSHFTLRYEGSQIADPLRAQILDTLEDKYKDLQNDLGASPKNIFVSLYTDQAFFDVTQAPAWSAALNDGKIRVPTSGITSMTPDLSRVLRHELTHSFIRQIAHGRIPQWINEGIAELEEGLSTAAFGSRLSALYSSGHQIPLNLLEGNFDAFSADEATVAYAESLAAVEYIRNTYGMADLARILQRLGEGQSIESALRSTIHGGYAELETEMTSYLRKKYGA
jgi:tetratricopeptide (TPR) repeat protein